MGLGTQPIEERVHWSDRDAIIPAGLGVAGVPTEVAGLYVKMKLVGTESRSSLDRLRARTGWGRDKLKKWQMKAWEMGWLLLLTEGCTSWDAKNGNVGKPRQWWLCSKPYELPPLDVVDSLLKLRTLPPQPAAWGRVLKISNLKFSSLNFRTQTSALTDQQVPKKTNKRESRAKAPLAEAAPQKQKALDRLSAVRLVSRYGRALMATTSNLDHAVQLEALLGADLEVVYQNYLSDPGQRLKDEKHPLGWLMPSVETYLPAPPKQVKAQATPAAAPIAEATGPVDGRSLLDKFKDIVHQQPKEARQ